MPVDISLVEECGPFQYGRLEQEGLLWRKWLESPDEFPACIITPCTLTIKDLWEDGWWISHDLDSEAFFGKITTGYVISSRILDANRAPRHFPPNDIEGMAETFDLSEEQVYKHIVLKKKADHGDEDNAYYLIIGPGVIFAVDIIREDGPHWSEIALAAYRHYETKELAYVFQFDVVNHVTGEFVKEYLYGIPYNFPRIAPADMDLREWGPDLDESKYHALLATPNVRGSVALLLGRFVPGTMHIPHIHTWFKKHQLNICISIAPLLASEE